MFRARLELNGKYVDLGAESLAEAVSFVNATPETSDFYEELARCPFANVREAVANQRRLSDKAVLMLAADSCRSVLKALINNDDANQGIPSERIAELIDSDDLEMLQVIAQNMGNMTQLDGESVIQRLSVHSEPSIRVEVARSSQTDSRILRHLSLDEDPDVRRAALKTLESRDIFSSDGDTED